ncbi:MAG: hypothetical protein Q8O91_05210 [Candidatus Aminicenantes bacterium]|nr:hypothetical protein [Candidatus Aminicenantes bacterium]
MNEQKFLGRGLKILVFLLTAGVLAGVAADKPAAPQAAVSLTYKFTEGTALSYKQTGTQLQDLDVMGQSMTTESNSSMDITLKSKGLKDGNHILGVTIDGMTSNVSSPQGNITPDMSGIIGKSFDLVFSPLGKEVDVSGASVFTIDTGQSGRRDLSSDFQGLFPDLPDHPVKVGDKWPSEDAIVQKSDAGEIHINFKNEHTLDGFETIDGRECARVKTVLKGTISGALNQGGAALAMDAKLEGTETWYFAVKEGVFVKSEMKATMGGVITADAMNMTINFTGEQLNSTTLIKK